MNVVGAMLGDRAAKSHQSEQIIRPLDLQLLEHPKIFYKSWIYTYLDEVKTITSCTTGDLAPCTININLHNSCTHASISLLLLTNETY